MKLSILSLLTVVFFGLAWVKLNIPFQYHGNKTENPGWYEQWFRMKKNENGEIPHGWAAEIRAKQATLRTAQGLLTNLTELGPFDVGGRTRAMVIETNNTNHLIAGGASGGVWNSFDGGQSWTPVNDQFASLSVTCMDNSPLDPNKIIFGTGESTGNSAGVSGDGLWMSTDGGLNFSQISATTASAFDYCWTVKCSPVDTNTFYVGTRYSGVYRTTDNGATFQLVYTTSSSVTDIELGDDGSVWFTLNGTGIFKSPDGSAGSFVQQTNGLPSSLFKRIEMDICNAFPNVMYAAFEDDNGNGYYSDLKGVYKSSDGGSSWYAVNNPVAQIGLSMSFPWYAFGFSCSPEDSAVVMVGSVGAAFSTNNGTTWQDLSYSHADYHAFVFEPGNAQVFYACNDGGIHRYQLSSASFSSTSMNNGYNTTQFYTGAYWPTTQITVMGGLQDNGTDRIRNSSQIADQLFGGDGGYCAVNQQNGNKSYVSYQYGLIYRADNSTNTFPSYFSILNELDANFDGSIDDGVWFINPFEINPADGSQLYFPTQSRVFRTTNDGDTWEPLTNSLSLMGTPYSIGISNETNPTVYISGENALFYRVDQAATAPTGSEIDLTASVPLSSSNGFISSLKVHPNDPSVVYASFSNISQQPRLWKITDANTASPVWTDISGDLPLGLPVNYIEVDPWNPDSILFAATDFGLYTSIDGGTTWTFENGIPNTVIYQAKIRPFDHKLFIYTHGRGIWMAELGNVTGLGQMQSNAKIIELYPNPVSDRFHINTNDLGVKGTFRAEIFDVQGKKCESMEIYGFEKITIPCSQLQSGVYFIKLFHENKFLFQGKFIKRND